MRKLILWAALCAALATPARATLTTTNSTISYTSNGVTVAYAVPYRFLDSSHLVVQKTVSAVTTTLVSGTDFTVTGANLQAGGTVTLTVAVANGGTVKISRSTPKSQTCALRTQGSFSPKTLEDCLDRLEMQIQEMNDGTFTQLLATPVTTAQASIAAPISSPNSGNTNSAGVSASFAAADHVHQCATPTATQKGCITTQPFAAANTAASQSIPNNVATIVVYGTVEIDTDSGYNSGTGRYTIPAGKGGQYLVTGQVVWSATPGANSSISVYRNAVALKQAVEPTGAGLLTSQINALISVAAGDVIDIRVLQASGGAVVLDGTATRNYFAIKQLPN